MPFIHCPHCGAVHYAGTYVDFHGERKTYSLKQCSVCSAQMDRSGIPVHDVAQDQRRLPEVE